MRLKVQESHRGKDDKTTFSGEHFMKTVRQIKKITGNKLFLNIPKDFQQEQVEVIILPYYSTKQEKTKYDFSSFAGKLKWKGNAVKQQREIRNEWE